jgi:hypothetical protein
VGVGHGDGRVANPTRSSPGSEERRGGRAMTARWWWGGSLVVVALELEEERWRAGMGVAKTGRGLGLL